MITGTRHRIDAEIARQQKLSAEIARAQSDISSKTRLQAASDDPAAAARVAQIRRDKADEAAWSTNVEVGIAMAARVDTTLSATQTALERAKELMLTSANGATSAADRATIAIELAGIVEDLTGYAAQTDSRGQPLFADGPALAVPIGRNVRVAPGATKIGIFEGVATADGPQSLVAIVGRAIAAAGTDDAAARDTATTAAIAAIDAAFSQVTDARSARGVVAGRLDVERDRFAASGLRLDEEQANLSETDIPATAARLQARLLSLEAAQAVFAKVSQSGLFDYIKG